MLDFLKTPVGVAVFSVAAVIILLAIIELNYKIFTKQVLDFIFAVVCTVVCSPVIIVCAVLSKKRAGTILEKEPFLGAGGKIIYLHAFSGAETRVRYTARLFDILSGKLSFVGVKPLPVEDGALMSDEQMSRFTARPGLISHLSVSGYKDLTYEDMFDLDVRYAKKRGLYYDIWIAIMHAVLFCRGEGKSYLGETVEDSYTNTLLRRNEITADDAERARKLADDAVADEEKALEFKKDRYSKNIK